MKGSGRIAKNIKTVFLKTALVILLFALPAYFVGAASAPNIITYQGRILNANGVPVSDSSVSMKFEFYDAATGGTCLWSNSSSDCDSNTPASTTARTVTLNDGLFTEYLGDTTDSTPYAAIPDSLFADNASVYLQVYIEGEELTPRKMLGSVPYALNADTIDGLDSSVFNLWTDAGTETYLTSDTDDFVIGGTSVSAAPFAVDESANTIFVGEGSGSDAKITFKSSGGDTGDLTYTTDDRFDFSGGNLTFTGVEEWNSAGTENGLLHVAGSYATGASGSGTYLGIGLKSAIENTSTQATGVLQDLIAVYADAQNVNTGELNTLYGTKSIATNLGASTAPIGAGMYGTFSSAVQNGAGSTVSEAYGLLADVTSLDGTITTAYGIKGKIGNGTGVIGTGIAGDFENAFSGTTRYGIRATASGGTDNYAGYFYGSSVHIEATDTPTTPTSVDGAGDLYIFDQLEIDGVNQTTGNIIDLDNLSLTTGKALQIRRMNDVGTDFTNAASGLIDFEIQDTGSSGNLLYLSNSGTGNSLYINQIGNAPALYAQATNTNDYIASFFNDGNSDSNQGLSIQACLDTTPSTACNYLVFKDGDGGILGAVEGDGAGGVTNASAGADYAELFNGNYADFSVGDIVGLDSSGRIKLAQNDEEIIGAFSVAPNTLGNWVQGWRESGSYVPVALLGRVPVNVDNSGGNIAVGDYITISSTAGVGRRASGVGYVLGQALEPMSSSSGTIDVLINPHWAAVDALTDAGDFIDVADGLRLTAEGSATVANPGYSSREFVFRGSGWNGTAAENVDMSISNSVIDADNYGLSIKNNDGTEVAYISQDGDLSISGRLYPSDRGNAQTDKYIYYDGSTGAGGDFMRTNASGWGAGSYDFAEMFPSPDSLSAGEVVIFANHNESVKRSTGLTYDDKIAGVISTQPGFLAGENKTGYVPVALAGRVPTYVSGENGDIAIGDPLTTSSKPGYAMKATEAGQIVGYAMEPFSGSGTGVIVAFIRPSYYDGQGQEEEFLTNNVVSKLSNVKKLDLSGIVNLNGGSLISTAKIEGIGKRWAIKENGDLTTKGEITQIVKSYQGDDVALSTALTIDKTVELIGTVEMKKGYARVKFEDFDERFNDVIANSVPYKVFLTADAPTDILYATDRTNEGFVIKERNGKSNANIDWRVVAYRKDYKPDWIDEQKGAQVNNVDEGSVNDTENSDKSSDNEMNEDVVNNIDQDNDVALDPDVENSAGNNANEAVDGDSDNSVESTTDNVDLSDDEIDIIDNNLKDLTDTENTNIVDDQEQNNNESDNHDAIVNEEASEPEADSGQDNLVNAEKSDESHDTAKDQNVITKDTDEETVIDTGVINSLEDDNSAAIQSENIIDSSSESN